MARLPEPRVVDLVQQLTTDEKIQLVSGANAWETPAIPRLGIPAMRVSDGPNGARGTMWTDVHAHCFPSGTSLGATFDIRLVEEIGGALGDEARTKGARVLLAPTVNLHRTPIGGRNFECMSEDPELTARLTVAYTRGVQSRSVSVCIKHFVANDTEFQRMSVDSVVAERVLRQVYLRPFEAAVTEAGARSIMSSYNMINGLHADMHPWLLTTVLRDEWDFAGAVISDWGGTNSTVESLQAGLDLEMPGPPRRRGELLATAIADGSASIADLDRAVTNVLELAAWTGALDDGEPGPEVYSESPEVRALIRRAASEGMVLLKNEAAALPLQPARLRRVAVIGPNAERAAVMGGGSATVRVASVSQPLAEITQALAPFGVEVVSAPGCSIDKTLPVIPGEQFRNGKIRYFDGTAFGGEATREFDVRRPMLFLERGKVPVADIASFSARLTGDFVPATSGRYTFGLAHTGKGVLSVDGVVLIDNSDPAPGSSFIGTGCDEVRASVELAAGVAHHLQLDLVNDSPVLLVGAAIGVVTALSSDPIADAVALAATADVTIIVAGTNGEWESEGHDQTTLTLPGDQDELISRVAEASRTTVVVLNVGSPCDLPWRDSVESILVTWFAGEEVGAALADVLMGDSEPGGRLPVTFPHRLEDTPAFEFHPGDGVTAMYGEGLLIGHRWYDATGIEPLYAFGHGLGYTTWSVSDPRRTFDGVTVLVANTGARAGATVVQVYARIVDRAEGEPVRELVGFAKVWMEHNEQRDVKLSFSWPAWIPADSPLEIGFASDDLTLTV